MTTDATGTADLPVELRGSVPMRISAPGLGDISQDVLLSGGKNVSVTVSVGEFERVDRG